MRLYVHDVVGEYFCNAIMADKYGAISPSTKGLNEIFPFRLASVGPENAQTLAAPLMTGTVQ